MQRLTEHRDEQRGVSRKQTYSSPKLVRYGDLRTLTQGGGGTSNDGAGVKTKASGGG